MSNKSITIQQSSKTPTPAVDKSTTVQTVQPAVTVIEPSIEIAQPAVSITDNKTGKSVTVSSPVNQNIIITSTGLQGPQGERGERGPEGGPSGSQGPAGPSGSIGPVGPSGSIGPAGPTGSIGPAGPSGSIGPQGEQGPSGSIGPAGPTGSQGPQGEQGPSGSQGIQGPTGPAGPSGSALLAIRDEGIELTPTASAIDFVGDGVTATASASIVTVTINSTTFPFTGDAEITGSLDINGTGGDIFLIKSSSFGVMNVEETGAVTLTNNAPTMFLIRNTSFAPILAVSQSGVVIFATQSAELTGTAPNGGLYFTSSSLFVGLD